MTKRGKSQHVVPRDGGWAVRGEGNDRDTQRFRLQKDAIDAAIRIAKNNNAEVLIHRRDGRIRERNSYGKDPFPSRGSDSEASPQSCRRTQIGAARGVE